MLTQPLTRPITSPIVRPLTDPPLVGGAWPPILDGVQASLALDFVAGRYWWSGASRAITDMTFVGDAFVDAGGLSSGDAGSVQLLDVSWWNQGAGTLIVETYGDPDPAISDYTLWYAVAGGDIGGDDRCEIWSDRASTGAYATYSVGYIESAAWNQRSVTTSSWHNRTALTWEAGGISRIYANGNAYDIASVIAGPSTPNTSKFRIAARGDGYNNSRAPWSSNRVKRVLFFPSSINATSMSEYMLKTRASNVHVLGDSFVSGFNDFNGMGRAVTKLFDDVYRVMTFDGVGGASMLDHASRFAATPQYYDRTLVIMDGGLSDSVGAAISALDEIVGRLSHSRWLYVQPSPADKNAGSPERAAFDADVAAIATHITTNYGAHHYVECLTALKAGNDGSPDDLLDVANDIVPRSLRSDSIHENSAGAMIRTSAWVTRIIANGW